MKSKYDNIFKVLYPRPENIKKYDCDDFLLGSVIDNSAWGLNVEFKYLISPVLNWEGLSITINMKLILLGLIYQKIAVPIRYQLIKLAVSKIYHI